MRRIALIFILFLTNYAYAVMREDFNGDGCVDVLRNIKGGIEIYHSCGNNTSSYSIRGNYNINGAYDTDGEAGKEIGIVQKNEFIIINDRNGRVMPYRFRGDYSINGAYDTDGEAGKEIGIVQKSAFIIINDRNGRVKPYRFRGGVFH